MNLASLNQRDRDIIWHPFTQHGIEREFLPVVAAKGAQLLLENGETVIDAISSWWVNIHGHAHPKIAEAIHEQALKLEHVLFAGCTHEPAVQLAEYLMNAVKAKGTNLQRCFYSDNGSTAVEVAMKMAYQYFKNKGITTRKKFVALSNSYHGDTLGSMSLSARGSYHQHFAELLPQVDFISPTDLSSLDKIFDQKSTEYAALIVEPMVQAAGGMQMHSAEFLQQIAKRCHEKEILLIADEIFTGFYRTGKCFAFEHAGIKPDLLCLGKGLTGGFLPLAVTLTTEDIFSAFKTDAVEQAFLHGHSFTANPLACAAALASWELLQHPATLNSIRNLETKTQQWVNQLAKHPNTKNTRTLGTIGVIELGNIPNYFTKMNYKIRSYAVQCGVLLRPMGPVLSTVPPYCVSDDEIDKIFLTVESVLDNIEVIHERNY